MTCLFHQRKPNFEKTTIIKFCFAVTKTFTQLFQLMKKVYGDNCISQTRIYKWYTCFTNGRENINDEEHNDCHHKFTDDQNLLRIQHLNDIIKEATKDQNFRKPSVTGLKWHEWARSLWIVFRSLWFAMAWLANLYLMNPP